MKTGTMLVACFSMICCSKKADSFSRKPDSTAIIESINVVRAKYNDSIKDLQQPNVFGDLSGNHVLKFDSDEEILNGNVTFNKTAADEYDVNGRAVSGKNKVTIIGSIRRVSEKHLNFEGRIAQIINGKKYVRTQRTTFMNEGKGNFWRLQDKVNQQGFVEYIDIYF